MFQDFVFWHICSPADGDWFMSQPAIFIVELWNGQHKRLADATNDMSRATAKQSVLIELAFASFGGESDKVDQTINRYLAHPELDKNFLANRDKIPAKTAKEFWLLYNSPGIPAHIRLAFARNKELMTVLESLLSETRKK